MPKRIDVTKLTDPWTLASEQVDFIEQNGETLDGYIQTYAIDGDYTEEQATAIYNADMDWLEELTDEIGRRAAIFIQRKRELARLAMLN